MNEWIIAWVNMVYDASESLAYTPLLLRINILFSKVKVIFKEKFYVPCSLSLWDLEVFMLGTFSWNGTWNILSIDVPIEICNNPIQYLYLHLMPQFKYRVVIIGSSITLGFKNLWLCLQPGNHILENKINEITR